MAVDEANDLVNTHVPPPTPELKEKRHSARPEPLTMRAPDCDQRTPRCPYLGISTQMPLGLRWYDLWQPLAGKTGALVAITVRKLVASFALRGWRAFDVE